MPVAKPDLTGTLRGVPVTIAVLGNDDGSNLTIVGYTLPVHGTLVLNADRSFTYAPAMGFVGVDAFAYTVRDGVGGTAEGEVTINVTRPNTPPVAANDEAATVAGAPVDVAVLANDNDPDGDELSLLAIDAPGHGTVTVLPDHSIRYVPLPGFSGLDSFAYTVGDGMGAAATAQVLVTVGIATSPPLARDDAAGTAESEAVVIDVLANDNDPDGGPVSLGGFTMPEDGSVSPTADHKLAYTPEPGFSGTDRFAYVVRDDDGESATGHVTVTVAPSNAAPVPVSDFALSAGEPITLDLLANDSDPDGEALKLAALTLPIDGDIAIQADGRVTYNPAPGFVGTDSFTYQVTDGTTAAEADVHISVSAPPVTTFANGYMNQHELHLPAWASGAPVLDNFLLPVAEQRADLKSAANGGPVQSAQGFDIRFETTTGVKLGHVILSYDGVTGTLVALVNMPLALASAESIYLYTGKAGLAVSEEDAVAARAGGWLAWYAGHPGADRSGQSRDLAASGPTPVTLGLWPAASLDGVDDKFTQGSSAWLNGLSALTVISLHQASRIDQKSEVFNVAAGAAAELSLHFANEGDRLIATAKFGTTLHQFQSANNRQTTQPQAVAFVAAAGALMRMAIDGAATVPAQSTGNLAGTLSVADTLEWGAGGRGDLIHWSGKLAFLAFCAGTLPVAAITRNRVASLLADMASRAPVAADRCRVALSTLFAWAMKQGLAETNPAAAVARIVEPKARERTLGAEELREVWLATEGAGDFNAAVRLLLLTGQRREEVGAMTWDEIDARVPSKALWSLSGERTKNRRGHNVPLSSAALAVLEGVHRRDGRALVFGIGAGGFSGWSNAKASLDARIAANRAKAAGRQKPTAADALAPWRLHDLRRSVVTHMVEIGIQPHIIEAVVNHISGHKGGVAGVYHRATYAAEKRTALERWAAWLTGIGADESSQSVVAFPQLTAVG